MEFHEMKENYTEMRKWLIERFGDVKVITENILKKLAKETIPDDAISSVTVTNYYRKLNSVLIKIKELNKTVNMPAEELNAHIYSSEFISKLLGFVLQRANLRSDRNSCLKMKIIGELEGQSPSLYLQQLFSRDLN